MSRPSSPLTAHLPGVFTLAAVLITALALSPVALAQQPSPRVLYLEGTGTVAAEPDMAVLSFGVVTTGETARAALDQNTAAMAKTFKALERAEIPGKDVQTSDFGIQPRFKSYPRGQSVQTPEITGYTVRNQVTVSVRDLEKVGGLIDTLVSDGTNDFQNLSFGFQDPEPLMNQARREAAADVQEKARLYAEALGVTLGPIIRIQEQAVRMPRPEVMMRARTAARDVPIAAGESGLSISISVQYSLVD